MGSGSSKSNRSKEPAENTNAIQKVQDDKIKNIDSSEKIKPRDYAPKGVRKPHPPIELPKKPPRRTSGDFVAFEPEQLQLKDDWELEKGVDDETPLSDVSYPTPRPGKVITDRHSFSDVDFTIFKTNNPYLAKGTFEEVATEVTKDWESELSKVRALCTWISCQRVRTRTYSNEANDSSTVAGYLKQVKELDGTFAALLARLCSHFVPQPAVPTEVGFGPATLCENAGLFSPSHEGGIVFYKVNEEHTIKFLNTDKLSLRHEIENPEYETDDLRKYCKMIVRKSEIDFVVNLPLHGEFALRIYKMNDKMEGTNVCNYLFTDADDGRGRENVFQRKARWTLREGTAGHEVQVLEQALQKFNQVKIKHDHDYLRGSRRLKYLQLRKGLRDGRMRRHEETLEKAVAEAKASSFHRALGRSIDKANVLLKQLSSLEANCHPVQDMCHKTISEIANFNKPTRDVHNTMIATYLLLGESRFFLETWSNIQALLRRQGKESIQYRITEFQKQAAPDRAIIQAVQHLHNLVPKAYIVSASLSAAAFYDWVSSVLSYLKNTSQNAREAEAEEIDLLDEKHMYLDDVGSDEGFQDSHDIETSSTSAADKSSKAS